MLNNDEVMVHHILYYLYQLVVENIYDDNQGLLVEKMNGVNVEIQNAL